MKLSDILLFLTVLQFIFAQGLANNLWTSELFTVQHEDYVFIAHLMTWFIVKSIESIKE